MLGLGMRTRLPIRPGLTAVWMKSPAGKQMLVPKAAVVKLTTIATGREMKTPARAGDTATHARSGSVHAAR